LPEIFRLVANDLIKHLAVFVGVVIGLDDAPFRLIAPASAFAVCLERTKPSLFADVVFAFNIIIAGKAVDDEAVRSVGIELY